MKYPASGQRGHIIVFANEKGGVGKSTSAFHTCIALCNAGESVAALDVDLRERDLARALAAKVLVAESAAAEVALGQALQPVGAVGLEHVALEHGVVAHTRQRDAVVGEDVRVVLGVLRELGRAGVLEPGPQALQHPGQRQLFRRCGAVVGQRDLGRPARLHRQADAHDAGTHAVQ